MVSWKDSPPRADFTFDGPWQDEIAAQNERDREALETLDEREPEEDE